MDGGSEEEVGILTIVNLVYTALMNNLRLLLWEPATNQSTGSVGAVI